MAKDDKAPEAKRKAKVLRPVVAKKAKTKDTDGVHVTVTLGVSGDADANPLAVVRGITRGIKSMDAPLRDSVHRARELRFTWEEIGEALGVTRQSAWERFSTD